jgi:hypothetical protein
MISDRSPSVTNVTAAAPDSLRAASSRPVTDVTPWIIVPQPTLHRRYMNMTQDILVIEDDPIMREALVTAVTLTGK